MEQGLSTFFDFNIAATLISFNLFVKWLESRAKANTGDAIASLLAFKFRLLCTLKCLLKPCNVVAQWSHHSLLQ